jgi:hypothetical protein
VVSYTFDDAHPDADAMRQRIAAIIAPASPSDLITALSRLRLCTVRANRDDDDTKLQMVAYAEALSRYPGDLVISTIEMLSTRAKFFPALAEIIDAMPARARLARMMADAARI